MPTRQETHPITVQDVTERLNKIVKSFPDFAFHSVCAQHKVSVERGTNNIFNVIDVKINTEGDDLYICFVIDDAE